MLSSLFFSHDYKIKNYVFIYTPIHIVPVQSNPHWIYQNSFLIFKTFLECTFSIAFFTLSDFCLLLYQSRNIFILTYFILLTYLFNFLVRGKERVGTYPANTNIGVSLPHSSQVMLRAGALVDYRGVNSINLAVFYKSFTQVV